MTRTLAFEMLAQGNTGSDILQILDVIQQDTDSSANLVENETSITVEFWYLLWVLYVLHMGFLMCNTWNLCVTHMCNTQFHSGWHIEGHMVEWQCCEYDSDLWG